MRVVSIECDVEGIEWVGSGRRVEQVVRLYSTERQPWYTALVCGTNPTTRVDTLSTTRLTEIPKTNAWLYVRANQTTKDQVVYVTYHLPKAMAVTLRGGVALAKQWKQRQGYLSQMARAASDTATSVISSNTENNPLGLRRFMRSESSDADATTGAAFGAVGPSDGTGPVGGSHLNVNPPVVGVGRRPPDVGRGAENEETLLAGSIPAV